MSSTEAIHMRNVVFGYDPQTPVLQVDELRLKAGRRVFLYGPSGSGKTTLLGLITGVLQPQRGLKPLYNFMDDLPALEGATLPMLPVSRVERTGGSLTSFDAGRGCPFQCSFCTIINVQGRKSRHRTPE